MLLISALPKLYAEKNSLNGLSNISTNTQNSSSNWVVSADFLSWLPSEEVSSIWADVISIGNNTSSWEALGFNFKWDYGFRIGTGYSLVKDRWDTSLHWTWFHTSAKHTIPT